MTHPARDLHDRLDSIRSLLARSRLISLSEDDQRSLRAEAEELRDKLSGIQGEFLVAGLLGGTGVGKSTLMNAMAGSNIASTSHRRPHTDRILIYRHREADPLPSLDLRDVPWQEILHEGDAVRQVLLCDLPDFDSMEERHRERVLLFMGHLDLLLWVTSPEKYADARFYQFLECAPKARQNFIFVLNKADMLFQGQSRESGYGNLDRIVKSFREHIQRCGMNDPVVYPVSALEPVSAGPLSPWNQFSAFRGHVFRHRDFKQISAIKAANLDVQVQRLVSHFEREAELMESFEQAIRDAAGGLEAGREEWIGSGREIIDVWMDEHMKPEALSGWTPASALVGPGLVLGELTAMVREKARTDTDGASHPSAYLPPADITAAIRRRLEWIDDQIRAHALRRGIPSALWDPLTQALDPEKRFNALGERCFEALGSRLKGFRSGNALGFRLIQHFAYLFLLVILLFALGGEDAWYRLIREPGPGNAARLLISMTNALFGAGGLAALGTYALLNLFLAFRFLAWYKKRLRRTGRRLILSVKAGLMEVWKEHLNSTLALLKAAQDDARTRQTAFQVIREK